MTLRRDLLCSQKDTMLEAMFSGRHELTMVNGRVKIDRNFKVFKLMINYLRDTSKLPTFKSEHQEK